MADIIDFLNYYKKKNLILVTEDDIESLKEVLKQDKEHIEWASFNYNNRKYSLFFNTLFHNNHEVRKGRNLNSAYLAGFMEEHLNDLEKDACEALFY